MSIYALQQWHNKQICNLFKLGFSSVVKSPSENLYLPGWKIFSSNPGQLVTFSQQNRILNLLETPTSVSLQYQHYTLQYPNRKQGIAFSK